MLLIYREQFSKDCVVNTQKHRGEKKSEIYVATYM